MTLTLEPQVLPLKPDADGTVRVSETRVTLDTLVNFYRQGHSAEQLHEGFPSVPLADVHAVIGYYLRHRHEVEAYMAERRRLGEEARRKLESLVPPNTVTAEELRARIRARHDANGPQGGT